MRKRLIWTMVAAALVVGATASVGLADDTANTGFVAQVSDEGLDGGAVEAETLYIRYHVCSLNEEASDFCDDLLDDFDPDTFDWVHEIEVTANENGEFTHGSFVSAFARETTGPGKGCLMRYVAGSNWGKPGVDLESYEVIEQAQIHCGAGHAEEAGDKQGPPPWAGKGKPEWAGTGGAQDQGAGSHPPRTGKGKPPWAGGADD